MFPGFKLFLIRAIQNHCEWPCSRQKETSQLISRIDQCGEHYMMGVLILNG